MSRPCLTGYLNANIRWELIASLNEPKLYCYFFTANGPPTPCHIPQEWFTDTDDDWALCCTYINSEDWEHGTDRLAELLNLPLNFLNQLRNGKLTIENSL